MPITTAEDVLVRPAVTADLDALRRFLIGLSPRSAYRRFFTSLGSVSDRTACRLLRRDHDQEALLAFHGPEVIGHGMYGRVPGQEGVVELGVVVADDWQRHGIGPLLARCLLDAARDHGFREIRLTVLAQNRPALQLVGRSWPQARPVADNGTYEYQVPLPEIGAA
jgi:GNAT superfamily N-acetyltransferase